MISSAFLTSWICLYFGFGILRVAYGRPPQKEEAPQRLYLLLRIAAVLLLVAGILFLFS